MTSSDFTLYILKGKDSSTTITLYSVKPTANLVKVVCIVRKERAIEGGKRHKTIRSKLAASIILRFHFADFFPCSAHRLLTQDDLVRQLGNARYNKEKPWTQLPWFAYS